MRYVTINKILACYPCDPDKVKKLAGDIDYDTPVSFKQIYDAVSFEDALWCIGALDYDAEIQAFALRCSRLVEHYDDSGSAKSCNDTLEMYLLGNASLEELNNAASDAWDVWVARGAAWTAAKAARTAAWAAGDASDASDAWVANAAWIARSAWYATATAWDAGIKKQIESDFLSTFCGE